MRCIAILAASTSLTTLCAGAALAQDPAAVSTGQPFVLPEITISAGLEDMELSRSGSSVSVLTRDDLSGAPARPLGQTLSDLPGVAIRTSGPLGTLSTVSVRGAPGQYVPVLIDGIDVGDPASGQPAFDIGGLTGAGLNRVELLRGAQSALYGSRAVGGVVVIEGPRPTSEGLSQNFSIEAGSYETIAANYGAALRRGDTDLAFNISRVHSDGFSARDENDGNFEDDGFDATRLSFYGARKLDGGATIGLNGFWEESSADFDDFFGDAAGTPGDDFTDASSFGLRAFANFTTGVVDHDVQATRYRIDRESNQDGFADDFIGSRTRLSWQSAMDLGQTGARGILGVDTEQETADGDGKTRTNGVYTQINAPLGSDIDLTGSLRRDDHSEFGGFNTYRLSGVWRASPDLLVRAAVGSGYRAPSLYELNGPYGDPALQPEESRSYEIGVERNWGDSSYLRATAFWLKAEDQIGFDYAATACGQPFGCYAQVDGVTRRRGLEIDGRHAFANGTSISAAYTYTDNQVTVDWAEVPSHDLTIGVSHEFLSGTTAGLTLEHQADRAGDLEDFTTVSLSVAHQVRPGTEAYLRIENLLDEEYQLVDGYGTSDRAFYAGIRADF